MDILNRAEIGNERPRSPAGNPARAHSRPFPRPLAAALLALAAVLALAVPAHAQTEVPENWSLIPSDVQPGDSFRLLFASKAIRDAVPTGIGTYNNFVQGQAADGHADIQAYSSAFKVVASTNSVAARVNTETTYTAEDTGVPIYWLGGSKVADDYADFYDGDWDDEANVKDESGDARSLDQSSVNVPSRVPKVTGRRPAAGPWATSVCGSGNRTTTAANSYPLDGDTHQVADSDRRPFYALSSGLHSGACLFRPPEPGAWPRTGLDIGDSFRLLFATSVTRNAASSGIVDYNNFVRNLARGGHTDIQAYSSSFNVVGSTSSTDANDNTATTYTDDEQGRPHLLARWQQGRRRLRGLLRRRVGRRDQSPRTSSATAARSPARRTTPSPAAKMTGRRRPSAVSHTRWARILVKQVSGFSTLIRVARSVAPPRIPGRTNMRPFYALSGLFEVGQLRTGVRRHHGTIALRQRVREHGRGRRTWAFPVAATDDGSAKLLDLQPGGGRRRHVVRRS